MYIFLFIYFCFVRLLVFIFEIFKIVGEGGGGGGVVQLPIPWEDLTMSMYTQQSVLKVNLTYKFD